MRDNKKSPASMKTTKKWTRKKTCMSSSEKYTEAGEKGNGEGQGIQYVHCLRLQQKKNCSSGFPGS